MSWDAKFFAPTDGGMTVRLVNAIAVALLILWGFIGGLMIIFSIIGIDGGHKDAYQLLAFALAGFVVFGAFAYMTRE